MLKNYEATEHPDLYKKTYWGNFEHDPMDTVTINNRNKFAQSVTGHHNYRIIGEGDYRWLFDHFEIYTHELGYIVVVSPYKSVENQSYLTELGFVEFNRLYSEFCNTYIMLVNAKELEELFKRVKT